MSYTPRTDAFLEQQARKDADLGLDWKRDWYDLRDFVLQLESDLSQPEEVSMRDALKEIYRLTVVTTGCPMERAHQLIHQLAKPFVGADPYGSGPQKD